uniref:BLOC-1-related complex subunit 5 n=1 Tax=Angiostrongylus cantonensis TaxID=6313 RepID=A0A0K0CU64_ANGCA
FLLTGANAKKSKGIVVINSGNAKVESLEDDEVYKRFQDIPRFLPILRHSIGKKDVSPSDNHHRMSSRPLYRMASRFQNHLKLCAKAVTSDQNQIVTAIKSVDASTTAVLNAFSEKKRAIDNFNMQLEKLNKLYDDMLHVQLLIPSERLPPLSFSKVLERTPVSTSGSSSQQSTPRHVPGGSTSLPRPSTRDKRPHIEPIEEVKVVDRMK